MIARWLGIPEHVTGAIKSLVQEVDVHSRADEESVRFPSDGKKSQRCTIFS